MRKFPLLAALAFVALANCVSATTRTAASAEYSDVKTQTDAAVAGDTVVIPAGTATWTSTLTITKNITLQGQTLITGDHTNVDGTSHLSTMSATDVTVIRDDVPRIGSAPAIIRFQTVDSGDLPRVSGITFKYGTTVLTVNANGRLRIEGESKAFRVDHCHFDTLYGAALVQHDWAFGLVDHCIFDTLSRTGATMNETVTLHQDSYGGGTNDFGDGSWAAAANYGSSEFVVFEDCSFNNPSSSKTTVGGTDCWDGGRYVARYCLWNNTRPGMHGTESGGRARGSRALEFYNNVITYHSPESGANLGQGRGGGILNHDNQYFGDMTRLPLTANREYQFFSTWGAAGGNNPIDKNDAHGVYSTGTCTATTSTTMDHASDASATDHWVGYSLNNTVTGKCAYITASTATRLTFLAGGATGTATPLAFTIGDTYAIYKIIYAVDQAGMGAGLLMKNNPMVIAATGLAGWAEQDTVTEPLYSWANTKNGAVWADIFQNESNFPSIAENRDFYNAVGGVQTNATTPFNGTVGTGFGTLARRPTTCTTGVGYEATDASVFYQCSATNTWSAYYTPLVYPHPLTGNATGIILLIGGQLQFGNVIIGDTPTATLTVRNLGDDLLTVAGVSYPTGFTGATGGFSVAPQGSHDITVTFTPLLEIAYSGNIVVDSDADSGTEAIATSGTGVAGQQVIDFFDPILKSILRRR